MSGDTGLKRGINLPLAVFAIVGLVIGASSWLLPTEALAKAGPAMFTGFIIAVIPGIFLAVVAAYLGSAIPVAGGTYVITSRALSPFAGFLVLWCIFLGVFSVVAFQGGTFAIFLLTAMPGLGVAPLLPALIILLAAYLVNLMRVQISATVGMWVTLLGDVLAILLFIGFGIFNIQPANFANPLPNGIGPLLMVSLLFVYSFAGFGAILDLGGEIQNPRRNIPRALAISIFLLTLLYTTQAFVVSGTVPWGVAVDAFNARGSYTVTEVGARFWPAGLSAAVPYMIMLSIVSTIIPMFMAYARDIMMGGKDQLIPPQAGYVNQKTGVPVSGLTIILVCSALLLAFMVLGGPTLGIPLQSGVSLLAGLAAIMVLMGQVLLCLAALAVRRNYPEWDRKAAFRPGRKAMWFWGVGGVITSALFLLLVVLEASILFYIVAGWLILGLIYYPIRKWYLARKGVRLDETMRVWPAADEV